MGHVGKAELRVILKLCTPRRMGLLFPEMGQAVGGTCSGEMTGAGAPF